jgi:3-methyladenine DNA glycosylase/8-oxoguanine DNA glycosylase
MHLSLPTPADFHYLPTLFSHGWLVLRPNEYDEAAQTLSRIEQLSDGAVVRLRIGAGEGALSIDVDRDLTPAQQHEVERIVARMFAFDWDVQQVYAALRPHERYAWVERVGAGRMLVSPTVWEDLAKTLLTTNTTWTMTKGMVARLAALGEPHAEDGHAFPTPERIAVLTPDALNAQVRAGYRGASLHALASSIADGTFDAEALRDPSLPSTEIIRRLKGLRGFGPYAVGAMMRLLGRFDELGIDSVVRTMFKTQINGGAAATDREIAAFYAPFGQWRGLAVWLDVMRDDFPEA